MGLFSDLRYAVRVLGKSPGFTAVAVLALAFGIGVNAAIFTLLNAIALRPLPLRDAGEVVSMYQTMRGLKNRNVHGSTSYFSYPEYVAYRDQNQVFSGLAGYGGRRGVPGGRGGLYFGAAGYSRGSHERAARVLTRLFQTNRQV